MSLPEELTRIGGLGGLPDGLKPAEKPGGRIGPDQPSFSDIIGNLVRDVDNLQKKAEVATEKMVTGELKDVHQVIMAMEEAQTSFRLMMEVRNKMIEAYREVIRMQV